MGTDTGNLENENTVIIQEVVDLTKEALVATNSNMLQRNASDQALIDEKLR